MYFFVIFQLQQSNFSLEHPTQYFIESRNVREGKVTQVKEEKDPNLPTLTEAELMEFDDFDTQEN